MQTFKRKLRTLHKLLNKLVKYSKACNKVKCYVIQKNIIIEQQIIGRDFDNHKTKVPTKDIDSYIKGERARLFNYNNYEPKGINEQSEI